MSGSIPKEKKGEKSAVSQKEASPKRPKSALYLSLSLSPDCDGMWGCLTVEPSNPRLCGQHRLSGA